MFESINKNNLLNVHICQGDSVSLQKCKIFIENTFNINTGNNPDVFVREYDSFGIDDSREVARFARMRAIGEKKFIIFSGAEITAEAQDALLKLFEEPPPQTYFFVFLPNVENLRPTLLSRAQIIKASNHISETVQNIGNFMELNYAERLKAVDRIAKSRNKTRALEFLNILENELYSKYGTRDAKIRNAIKAIINSRRYLNDKGALIKQLLESAVIQVPISKK